MTYKKNANQLFVVCFLSLLLQGCTTPASKLDELAKNHNFQRQIVNAQGFAHRVYTSNLPATNKLPGSDHNSDAKNVLHVYLEGDGTPWKYRVITMPDPTPRDPLVLRLMARDRAATAYIGRPCYNGTSEDQGCDQAMWTSGRYSKTVVRSMSGVIRQLMQEHGFNEIKLIGHSGGGALAMLIAQRIKETSHVVTVAGNLDTDGWTTHHGYSPLYTSLNPSKQPLLSEHILQWHFVGGRDRIVPPSVVMQFIRQQENALGLSINNFNHSCCWESLWGNIASAIRSEAPGFLPGSRFKVPLTKPAGTHAEQKSE